MVNNRNYRLFFLGTLTSSIGSSLVDAVWPVIAYWLTESPLVTGLTVEHALRSPKFVTYLGRKAFAPDFPFYLGRGSSELWESIPVPMVVQNQRPIADEADAHRSKRPVQTRVYGPYESRDGRRLQLLVPEAHSSEERLEFLRRELTRIPH